ncbi:hypothetical protein BIZ37_24395 [Photobacterium sp. BZF1]|uniref:hypothetical protein n=1 Tax=Photobacterium sp. BZF1 TaxID=1904457 RepID=UPI001653654B|nr:hypothetical protein [Photobacterium sp. BZF1]MBC7005703.1 hypothetical protein [Photobacterium sp. BZF1]
MNKVFVLGVVVLGLFGCGGDSGGGFSDGSGNGTNSGSGSQEETFIGNGLYIKEETASYLIVDSERSQIPLIFGDYSESGLVGYTHIGTFDKGEFLSTGLSWAEDPLSGVQDLPEESLGAYYNNAGDSIALHIVNNEDEIVYPDLLKRTSPSRSLNDIEGFHTRIPGEKMTDIQIEEDGTFVAFGACRIEGELVYKDFYYFIPKAIATNCSDIILEGEYSGFAVTIKTPEEDSFVDDVLVTTFIKSNVVMSAIFEIGSNP